MQYWKSYSYAMRHFNVFTALIAILAPLCIPFIHLPVMFATIVNKIHLDFNGYIKLFVFAQ